MAYQPHSGITSIVSTVPSSVQVGASVIGLTPVNVINTANVNTAGSVVAFQGTDPWTVDGNVGQSGAIRTSVVSSTPSSMLVGASVFGNVGISGTPNVNTAGSVVAFQGTDPWVVDGSGSTQPISGNVGQTGTIRTSVVSSTPSSMLVGASVFGNVGISGTPNVNTAGSVVAFQGGAWTPNVSGSVVARNILPSSLLVGASIIGNPPVNVTFPTSQNVSGSVVAFQGTDPWVQTGSVQGTVSVLGTVPVTQSGTWHASVVSTVPSSVLVGASVYGIPNPLVITGSVQGAGAGTQYSEDAIPPADPTGTAQVLRRTDTPSVSGSADGDWVIRNATNYGAAYTQILDSSGNYVDTFGGGTQYTEDAVAAGDPVGNAQIIVATATPSIQGEDGDNIARRGTRYGGALTTLVDSTGAYQNTGSVAAFVQGTPNVNTAGSVASHIRSGSVVARNSIPSSMLVGASIFGLAPVNVTNATLAVTQSGTWNNTQAGTVRTSVVSSTPSSMLVGASVFGNVGISGTPNVNTAGSVVSFQGTDPWVVTNVGSIITANIGSVITVEKRANDVQGTADLRGNSGGSVVVIAAQGASVFTRITGVQVANIGGASVLVTLDGATSSTIGYTIAPDGGGSNLVYPVPLKTNANGAFTASISGQSSVLISAQGFTEAE